MHVSGGSSRQVKCTCVVLELCGETEMEGHVCGQNCTDDQLPDLLHRTCKTAQSSPLFG